MLSNQENKPDFKFKHKDVTLSFDSGDIHEIVANFVSFLEVCTWGKNTVVEAMRDYLEVDTELTKDHEFDVSDYDWHSMDAPPEETGNYWVLAKNKEQAEIETLILDKFSKRLGWDYGVKEDWLYWSKIRPCSPTPKQLEEMEKKNE